MKRYLTAKNIFFSVLFFVFIVAAYYYAFTIWEYLVYIIPNLMN